MMGSENALKTLRMASKCLERCYKNEDEFLSHIIRVSGDETCGLFMNVKTKEQSKQRMRTHSPNKLKKIKQTLSACQKPGGNCFLVQERSADGGIHATRDP
jgi:hypothetical protein